MCSEQNRNERHLALNKSLTDFKRDTIFVPSDDGNIL